jgi:hypothetical protein
MWALVKTSHEKDNISPTPEEMNRVGSVFRLAGGSWERVFEGSVTDLNLLKRVIKVAVKKGVFTKTQKWG